MIHHSFIFICCLSPLKLQYSVTLRISVQSQQVSMHKDYMETSLSKKDIRKHNKICFSQTIVPIRLRRKGFFNMNEHVMGNRTVAWDFDDLDEFCNPSIRFLVSLFQRELLMYFVKTHDVNISFFHFLLC